MSYSKNVDKSFALVRSELHLETIKLISFMVTVGAFIGAMTNFIAIRMIFRPHKPIVVFGSRLPFTPGLIPRRRDEIAHQLGRMVVDHLLTANGIANKLKSATVVQLFREWLERRIQPLLYSEKNIEQYVNRFLQVHDVRLLIRMRTNDYLTDLYERYRNRTVEECLPLTVHEQIKARIPAFARFLLKTGRNYLNSEEGKEQLRLALSRFLAQKGKPWNMLSMLISQDRFVDLVQKEIGKWLEDEATEQSMTKLCCKEWERLKKKQIVEFESFIDERKAIRSISSFIEAELFQIIDRPLKEWAPRYERAIVDTLIPNVVETAMTVMTTYTADIIRGLELDEIVSEQVRSFSTERLEALIISIAKRELKMITLLGALLGGIIGFVQSVIVLFS